jgi:chlorite dismutase
MSQDSSQKPGLPEVDVREHGGKKDGERQSMDRRLFMQLLVFDCAPDCDPEEPVLALTKALSDARIPSVVYDDVNAPRGVGLLTWSEDPAHFVKNVRPLFRNSELRALLPRPDFTMLGRSYASGYEPDLEHWLFTRPVEHVTNPAWPWAIWYPLRRSGAFARLDRAEQSSILREHAAIGLAYGQKDLAHDIRLASYGLDAKDNEFVIGLVGKDLHPLSHVVQSMRSTRQTAEYISQMGPFFTGYARWQQRGER